MQTNKKNNDRFVAAGRQHAATVGRPRFAGMLRPGILLLALLTFPCGAHPESPPKLLYQSVGISPGIHYSRPMGIFYDVSRKECYVADTGNNQIVVCDENGTAFYRFPHRISEDDESKPGEPKELVVDHSGRIFLVDRIVNYIDVLDLRGRRIQKIYPAANQCEEPARFIALALGPDNDVYAALSCGVPTVSIIDSALNIRRDVVLAAPKSEDTCISGIAVDMSGNIYITDPCATKMVQIYDADGKLLNDFGEHNAGLENFSFPSGIVVMSNGNIWVLDTIRHIASCFSKDGEFITYIGGRGGQPGGFNFPSALSTDGTGLLFILERAGNRYQCFQLSGSEQ